VIEEKKSPVVARAFVGRIAEGLAGTTDPTEKRIGRRS
jgi:hypothetical protein